MKTSIAQKILLVSAIATVSFTSFAKVSDFNSMITDNMKAQSDLHQELKQNMKESQEVAVKAEERKTEVIASTDQETGKIAKTSKNFLKFKKEMTSFEPSEKKQMKRLADEFDKGSF